MGGWGKADSGSWGKADSGKNGKDKGPYGKGKDGGGKGSMKGLLKGAIKQGLTPWGDRPLENQLYFRNLPSDCTDKDLYDLCAPFGAIPPKGVLAQQRNGECIGSGFVDFVDAACAKVCRETLDGHEGLLVTEKQASGSSWGKDKY